MIQLIQDQQHIVPKTDDSINLQETDILGGMCIPRHDITSFRSY